MQVRVLPTQGRLQHPMDLIQRHRASDLELAPNPRVAVDDLHTDLQKCVLSRPNASLGFAHELLDRDYVSSRESVQRCLRHAKAG